MKTATKETIGGFAVEGDSDNEETRSFLRRRHTACPTWSNCCQVRKPTASFPVAALPARKDNSDATTSSTPPSSRKRKADASAIKPGETQKKARQNATPTRLPELQQEELENEDLHSGSNDDESDRWPWGKDEPESPDFEEIEDPDGEGFPLYEAEWS
ncbi:hypothetical protein N656DRAFT_844776 [Canariomyces notabilis]|uniref:Uncharacterized protein n=1 Tax=Canariomyces notabilis TaxID=2074819 RepID=A0AAN6YT01_9PEZI|nr:hypothetical protein N656DRAFT_844776 [Canariomyces arenarius]